MFAAGVLVPVAVVVPQQTGGDHSIASTVAAALLWYWQLCLVGLPSVLAATLAGQRERGMRRQRVLDGEPEQHQTGAAALLFALVAGLGATSVTVLEVVVAALVNAASDAAVAETVDSRGALAATALVVVMSVSVGVFIGTVSGRAASAAAFALALGGLGLALTAAADAVPQLGNVAAALPTGALVVAGKLGDDATGQVDIAAIATFVWPVLAAATVVWSAACEPRARLQDRRRRRIGLVRGGLLVASAVAMAIGAVVPVALRDEIPWQYRPSWLADKAAHRTSVDVAATFLDDVRHGRWAAARRLTVSRSPQSLLGPYRRVVVGGGVRVLPLRDNDRLEPGEVPLRAGSGQLTMCLTRAGGRWRVTDLGSNPGCPAATVR